MVVVGRKKKQIFSKKVLAKVGGGYIISDEGIIVLFFFFKRLGFVETAEIFDKFAVNTFIEGCLTKAEAVKGFSLCLCASGQTHLLANEQSDFWLDKRRGLV